MGVVITMIHPDINIRPYAEDQSIRCDCMGGECACGEVHDLDYVDKKREEFEKLQAGGQQEMATEQPQSPVEELELDMGDQLEEVEAEVEATEVGEPETDNETFLAIMGLIANWLEEVENKLEGMVPTDDMYMELIRQRVNLEQLLNTYYGGAEGMELHVIQETIRHAKASIKACKGQSTRWLENEGVKRAVIALEVSRKVCDEALPMH